MELEQFTWDGFIAKKAAAEIEQRRKMSEELLQSENSFAYIEDLSSGQNGWALLKPDHNEYWLEWLYRVNRVD